MDISTLFGLIMCAVLVVFGIVYQSDPIAVVFGNLVAFFDVPSIIITFGGSFMCVLMMSKSFGDYFNKFKSFKLALTNQEINEAETIKNIIELSNIARKEGLLALEDAANNAEDLFLKKGLLLIVDGTDPELVSGIMNTELSALEGRHKEVLAFWDNLAAMGPAWGMIGTLIGLVNMLKSLSDVAAVGPSMAVALITTLYGSLLANWIATPISTKLKMKSDAEVVNKEMIVEGILSIQAGENPRVIEEKLKSYVAPKDRSAISDDNI